MKIELCGITKKYGKKTVLENINMEAESGMCVGILGVNGCGKSTLLSILAGVQRADSGKFLCNGTDLFKAGKLRSDLIGYVPQGNPLIEELSALDNLRLWYDRDSLSSSLDSGVLKMMGISDFLKVRVSKMSGGMKKRLSIGCAMAKRPPVLLLDEASSALDIICKKDIYEYLKKYCASGGLVIQSTHDSAELEFCDAFYIMKNGVLTPYDYDGDISDLAERL